MFRMGVGLIANEFLLKFVKYRRNCRTCELNSSNK